MNRTLVFVAIGVGVIATVIGLGYLLLPSKEEPPKPVWDEQEIAVLSSLWLGSLPPLPPDPSNKYADDPRAAALGEKLFFDKRFSLDGTVACATCHDPDKDFQDGVALAKGIGTTNRRTMPIVGTAYSPWFFWDGRKDSQWAQALGPLENPVEHGGNRTQYAHLIVEFYREDYEAIFGELPDLSDLPDHAAPLDNPELQAAWEEISPENQENVTRIYVNMGKAIAAYERTLLPSPTRFDAYVEAVLNEDKEQMKILFTEDEVAGLRLFIGEANCTQCHNGALFTDNHFHNTGVPAVAGLPKDDGRLLGAKQVLEDEFNCYSAYSDISPQACYELKFMVVEDVEFTRAYKPPSLRDVADRAPYMHAGQFATLEDVLNHYNTAPLAPVGHSHIIPLNLSEKEMQQLIAFLHTLSN